MAKDRVDLSHWIVALEAIAVVLLRDRVAGKPASETEPLLQAIVAEADNVAGEIVEVAAAAGAAIKLHPDAAKVAAERIRERAVALAKELVADAQRA